MKLVFCVVILSGVLSRTLGDSVFYNPILAHPTNEDGPYPVFDLEDTIYHSGSRYYLIGVNNSGIFPGSPSHINIRQSPVLTDFNNATISIPLKVPLGDTVNGVRLQKVNGSLYLYYNRFHAEWGPWRMYVMKADDPDNPMGSWSSSKPLFETDPEKIQYDGKVMEHDGILYWIGTELTFDIFNKSLNLRIFKMNNPMEITDVGVVLRLPTETWECLDGACSNTNPSLLNSKGVTYVVYLAGIMRDNSTLSFIGISDGKDPMNISNWEPPPGPVFFSNEAEEVYGVRTASFTDSPDGTEIWMVYHAAFCLSLAGRIGQGRTK